MKRVIVVLAGIIFLFIVGCTGVQDVSPEVRGIQDISPSGSSDNVGTLCAKYSQRIRPLPNMKAEIKRRVTITPEEWRLIESQKVRVGMSALSLVCSWGMPDRVNRNSYGDAQYVYTHNGASYGQYVYVNESKEPWRVTAWN